MTTEQAMAEMQAARLAKTKVDNALDQCGIGHDFGERMQKQLAEIAEFCSKLQARIASQAVYNLTHNVPCGIMRLTNATARMAIRQAIPNACGEFVAWDVGQALNLAADIAEDVNAHAEAKKIREMSQIA